MKKEGVVVVFLLITVLSLSLVSASWFSDIWSRITGRTITGNFVNVGGGVCECSSCKDCNDALANAACTETRLTSDIADTTSYVNCIQTVPSNKILDCQNHKIIGTGVEIGIYTSSKQGITVKNCVINNFATGIFVASGTSIKLSGNTITNSKSNAMNINRGSNNIIENNNLEKNNQGLFIYYSTGSQVNNNVLCSSFDRDIYSQGTHTFSGNKCDKTNVAGSCTSSCQAAACTENWQCGSWSTCTNNQQTRTCTDSNNCGTTNNKPPEVQSCTSCTPNCQNKQCGDNGCGGSCGTCQTGYTCSNYQCVSSCTPKTCSQLGKTCGSWNNGCGGNVSCGSCSSGQICSNGNCVASCTPATCTSLGYNCGTASNGCGGTLNCGTCPSGQTCQSNKCITSTPTCTNDCSPSGTKQCSGNGYQFCGNFDSDSCYEWGPATDCGTAKYCSRGSCIICYPKANCNKNSADACEVDLNTNSNNCGSCGNVCASGYICKYGKCIAGCVSNANVCLGKNCGVFANGTCGNISCGTCQTGQICSNGTCINLNLNISLSIATLKDNYSINEQIKLTDPPEDDIKEITLNSISGNLKYTEKSLGIEGGEITKISPNLKDENGNLRTSQKFEGYIIQFEEKPLIVRETELKKEAEKNQEKVKSMGAVRKFAFTRVNVLPEDVPGMVKIQKDRLASEHEDLKSKIQAKLENVRANQITGNIVSDIKNTFSKMKARITGKAVSNQELKVLGEFDTVFNGITLDITDEEAREIEKISGVKKVYPNFEIEPLLMNSVPLINADDVWQLDADGNNCITSGKECLTGKDVTIAVIDTGVDYTHSDLGGCLGENCKVIGGYDFGDNDPDPMDDQGHGTHVAGIAAGNGALKGVAPDAKIWAYKVFDSSGYGSWSDIISGIERAVDPNQDGDFSDKANIISMSLGAKGYYLCYEDELSSAITNTVNSGVVFTIAAGNDGYSKGDNSITYPACIKDVISVGSMVSYAGGYRDVSSFSSRGFGIYNGEAILKPDIVAPGENICAAQWDSAWDSNECFDDKHVAISGTSMATPMVAGAVALIKQAHPDWTPEEIKDVLMNNANKNFNWQFSALDKGAGNVDILNSIDNYNKYGLIATPGSVSFGIVDLADDVWDKSETISITNKKSSNAEVSINIEGDFPPGIRLDYPSNILVPSNSKSSFSIKVMADKNIDYGYYEGAVLVNFNTHTIRIPFFFKKIKLDMELDKKLTNKDISFSIFSEVPLSSIDAFAIDPDEKKISIDLSSTDSQNFNGVYSPKKDGNYIIKVEASDEIGNSLYTEDSFIADLTAPEINLSADQINNKISLNSNENINSYFKASDKINDDVFYPSLGIDKKDNLYINFIKTEKGGTYFSWYDNLINENYNSSLQATIVDGSELLSSIINENPSRYWGISLSIEENQIFFDSDNNQYSFFKFSTNNGFCGVNRIGLRKFNKNENSWETVNDNILNVDMCTDDGVMCQSPSSYQNEWCDFENGKFNKYITNPKFLEYNDNFYIFWSEPVSMTQYFDINGYLYNPGWYAQLVNADISFVSLNSFYKKIDKNGRILLEKTLLGTTSELASSLIDGLVKDKSGKLYIFLNNYKYDIDKTDANNWLIEGKNDVDYKVLNLETDQLGDIVELETDGYEFELASDEMNNIHVVYTNSTVFKGNENSIYGQLYYGIINFSTNTIDTKMQVKPSGLWNKENKITVNDLGDILIVHQNIKEGKIGIYYRFFNHLTQNWEDGPFKSIGFIPQVEKLVYDSHQSIYSLFFDVPRMGWQTTGFDVFIKGYINSPLAWMKSANETSIIHLVGKDKDWEGYWDSSGVLEAWGTDEAGNIGYDNLTISLASLRPQSKIVNNENNSVSGNLIIKIQKQENSNWIDYQTVYNQQVTIQGRNLLKLDSIFNPLNITINEAAKYRVYVDFLGKTASYEFNVK